MERKQRWLGKNRRLGSDRRSANAPEYKGPERRSGKDRRYREKPSLLVVDSSPTQLFYMGMLLKKLEYEVRTSRTAEDALQMLADQPFALVITESLLPRMSGINLLKQMRSDPRFKPIPVIMHTTDNDPAIRSACKIEGCAAFFKKPADPDALYRAIQTATESAPRQTIRIDTALPVEVGDGALLGGVVRTETATSLSEGGLYIKTLVPEPANTVIPLTLIIRNRKLSVAGIVLYSSSTAGGEHKDPGMAVRFVHISIEDKALIHDFIKEGIMNGVPVPKQ
jgi:two-component system chemotaxis response regulator CheY